MIVYEIELPWSSPPLSLNQRLHWAARAKKTAEVRGATRVLARQRRLHVGGPHPHVEVTLHYRPRDNRVRDVDNPIPTLKACCDGLVDAGVVVDDAPTHMTKHMTVIHEPGEPRLWLVVAIPPQRLSDAA